MEKLTAEQAYKETEELFELYYNGDLLGGNPMQYIEMYAQQQVKEQAIRFAEYINEIEFKKYNEGWCQAGGSNGWHCNSEELYNEFLKQEDK